MEEREWLRLPFRCGLQTGWTIAVQRGKNGLRFRRPLRAVETRFAPIRPPDKLQAVKALTPESEIVTRKGKPVSVIIPIKDYEELLERVEDTDDVAWLKRARRKPLHYRPLEDYLAERNRK